MIYITTSPIVIQIIRNMKTNGKKSFLATTPSVVLAILTLVGAIIVLFVVDGLVHSFDPGGISAYSLFGLLSAIVCFFIIKQKPRSVWYVPLIINLLLIISAFIEPNFWKRPPNPSVIPMWLPICIGWVLSIITSVLGAQKGRKVDISDNA